MSAVDGPGDGPERVRIDAGGGSMEQAESVLRNFYDGTRWSTNGVDGAAYSFHYSAVGDSSLSLRTSRMQGRITGDIPPGDDYIVQWVLSGSPAVDVEGDPVVQAMGQPLLFPAHRSFVFDYTNFDQRLVHLGRRTVEQVVTERAGVRLGPLRFDHSVFPRPAAVALWHDVITTVGRTLARGDVSPLVWHELTRMTAVAFLELYPPQVDVMPHTAGSPENVRLRQAVEYIHTHAHLPLTPTEIAAAAGTSVRTLQAAFQRALGISPLTYLRNVRLDRVREELLRRPDNTPIAAVALRWGFAHPGRFAAAYAARFGEHPRQTPH